MNRKRLFDFTISGKLWAAYVTIIFAAFSFISCAYGQNTPDSRFQQWLQTISLEPGNQHSIKSITFQPRTRDLALSWLDVTIASLDLQVTAEKIELKQVTTRAPDGFVARAASVTLHNFTFRMGSAQIKADEIKLNKVMLPQLLVSKSGEFSDRLDFLKALLALQANTIKTPKLTYQTLSNPDGAGTRHILSERQYFDAELLDVKKRKIGRWVSQASQTSLPPREPLLQTKTSLVQIQGLNFNALFHVLDTSQTITPPAQLISLFDDFVYENYQIEIGGLRLMAGNFMLRTVRLGRPDVATQKLLETVLFHDQGINALSAPELSDVILQLASNIDVAAFSLQDIKLNALGIQNFSLREFSLKNVSAKGIEHFSLEEFHVDVPDIGTFNLSSFQFADLETPDIHLLFAHFNGQQAVSVAQLMPSLGNISLKDLQIIVTDTRLALGEFEFGFLKNPNIKPDTVRMLLRQLELPSSLLSGLPSVAAPFIDIVEDTQLDPLRIDQTLKLSHDKNAKALTLQNFHIQLAKLGQLNIKAQFTDVAHMPAHFDARAMPEIQTMKLAQASIIFENEGLVEAIFTRQARKLGSDGETLRQQVSATLPFLVGVLQNPEFQQQLVAALQEFLPDPKSFIIELKPKTPVSISEIEQHIKADPRQLLSALGISVQSGPAGSVQVQD